MINFTKLLKIGLPVATLTAATIITATLLFSKREDNKDNDENKDKVLDDFEKPLELYQEEIINKPESESEKETEDDKKELDENQQKAKEKIEEQLQKESDKKQLVDDLLNRPDELIKKLSLEDKLTEGQLKEIVSKIPELEKALSAAKQGGDTPIEEKGTLENQGQDLPGAKDKSIPDPKEDLGVKGPGKEAIEAGQSQVAREEPPAEGGMPENNLGKEEQELTPDSPSDPDTELKEESEERPIPEEMGGELEDSGAEEEDLIKADTDSDDSSSEDRDQEISSDSEISAEGRPSEPSPDGSEESKTSSLPSEEQTGGAEDGQQSGEGTADSITEELLKEMEEITGRASSAISYLQNLLGKSGLR